MDTVPLIHKSTWKRRRTWAGVTDRPLRLAVPSKLQDCTNSLDVWNRTSLQRLRRDILRVKGAKLDQLLVQDKEYWRQRARTS
ncbi:hypothetical protein ACOSQ4_025472 [Xanthoceras sorbifolium]